MKKLAFVIFLLPTFYAIAQQPEIVSADELLARLNSKKSNKIQVINFWATWCAPCVKELPLFEKANEDLKDKVDVTLVSMDLDLDPNAEKVYRFVERKKLKSRVLLLKEDDPNSYIDRIAPQWSGALPATLVINPKTGQRKFVEKELHEGDIEKIIADVQ